LARAPRTWLMAALANSRQKPGSAAWASVHPDTGNNIRNDITNAGGKYAATNRSLLAMSPLPRMSPVPPPKVASRAEITNCSEPSRVLRLSVDLTVALFSLFIIFLATATNAQATVSRMPNISRL
jgi:hypothetical protein